MTTPRLVGRAAGGGRVGGGVVHLSRPLVTAAEAFWWRAGTYCTPKYESGGGRSRGWTTDRAPHGLVLWLSAGAGRRRRGPEKARGRVLTNGAALETRRVWIDRTHGAARVDL